MAAGPRIKIADAYFALGVDSDVAEAISGPMNKLEMVGGALMKAGAMLVAVWGSIGAGLAYATDMAGRHMQQVTRMSMIYDTLADSQMNWINQYTKATNRSMVQTTEIMGRASSLFKGYGFDERATAQMSRQLTAIIGDYQALIGLPMEETLQRVMSGMTGSGEAMERLSTNMKQAELDRVMKDMFGITTGQGATEMMKVMARMQIMVDTLTKQGALGYDMYADSYPKAMAITTGALKDLAEAVGRALVPAAAAALKVVYRVIKSLTLLAEKNPWLVKGFVILTGAITAVGAALLGVGIALTGLTMMVSTLAPVLLSAFGIITAASGPMVVVAAAIAALTAGLTVMAAAFAFAAMESRDSGSAIRQYLANLGAALEEMDVGKIILNLGLAIDTFMERMTVLIKKFAVYIANVVADIVLDIFASVLKGMVKMATFVLQKMQELARSINPLLNLAPDINTDHMIRGIDHIMGHFKNSSDDMAKSMDKSLTDNFEQFEKDARGLSELLSNLGKSKEDRDDDLKEMSQEELIDFIKQQLGNAGKGTGAMSPIKAMDFRTVAGQEAAYSIESALFNLLERSYEDQKANTEANKAAADALTNPQQPVLAGV